MKILYLKYIIWGQEIVWNILNETSAVAERKVKDNFDRCYAEIKL